MPDFIHRRQLIIEWAYCDPAGIVFNARFYEIFDAGSWALFEAALGVPRHKLGATFGIMGVPLVDARARFLVPVKFGDHVAHETQVSAFRRSSFDVAHRILLDGVLAAEGSETRVWAVQGEDGRLRSQPIPREVTARFDRN